MLILDGSLRENGIFCVASALMLNVIKDVCVVVDRFLMTSRDSLGLVLISIIQTSSLLDESSLLGNFATC
jgi:hypothetical protein